MNISTLHLLRQSWRSWLGSDPHPVGPKWLNLIWTFLFCCACAVFFTLLGFLSDDGNDGAMRSPSGWWHWYQINLVISLFIGFAIRGLFLLGRKLLGLERIQKLNGLPRFFYFSGIPMVGVAIAWPLGAAVAGLDVPYLQVLKDPVSLTASLAATLVIILIFNLLFATAARRLKAEKRAVQAQLRLLQGQIEPHFLFNTLANVVSLIDHDAPRAKQMLESFTDYLRSSFTSLRHDQATLGSELALAHAYLCLLKVRMDDRLQFDINNDPALHGAKLPPLLLQPLVENAIHHGLEPKLEGGRVQVRASVDGDTLVLQVSDDGMGLAAPARRRGAGMALNNLRERLLAQYGSRASLTLTAAAPGTVATLRLPFEKALPV